MKAFEIKLCWIVRDSMKSACCSVLKDQWLAIGVGFVISTTRVKSMRFHGQTTGAWELIDAIRSKNQRTSRSDFCVRVLILDHPGTPFDRLLQTFNIFGKAKKGHRFALQYRPPDCDPKTWFCPHTKLLSWARIEKGRGGPLLLWPESRVLMSTTKPPNISFQL